MDENKLLERITVNPKIFGGKPISGDDGLPWSMCPEYLPPEILLKRYLKATPGLRRMTSRLASSMPAGWSVTREWNRSCWREEHE